MEGHPGLSHQHLKLGHKKETYARHSLPTESSKLLHLEHLNILNFSYKTNHESAQFKYKLHSHKQNQALMKQRNNEL